MRKLAAVLLFTLLAACASAPQSPAQAVFQAKSDYAVALTLAVKYKALPPCPGPILCSDKAVVGQLQKADTAASALLDGAETAARAGGSNVQMLLNAATQAVGAFSSITKTLGVQ